MIELTVEVNGEQETWNVQPGNRLHIIGDIYVTPSFEDEGVALIAAERRRQYYEEGWTPEHDDEHTAGELAVAAACYAVADLEYADVHDTRWEQAMCDGFDAWPWGAEWDKRVKHSRLRCLEIAGALIAAEIDRLQRKDNR